jgi:hypothetical protein
VVAVALSCPAEPSSSILLPTNIVELGWTRQIQDICLYVVLGDSKSGALAPTSRL